VSLEQWICGLAKAAEALPEGQREETRGLLNSSLCNGLTGAAAKPSQEEPVGIGESVVWWLGRGHEATL
jgi:hypothetical protein